MGPLWQQYIQPVSLAEALQALCSAPGPACPIAGGTDLMLDLRQGRRSPVHTLVDVSGIPELTALEVRAPRSGVPRSGGPGRGGSELFIGAAAPVTRVIASPLVNQHARALVEACDLIGGPQVRNVATLGGNVAHALPAADGAIALLALGARVEVASLVITAGTNAPDSQNPKVITTIVPLLDLYLGPGKTALEGGQLLAGFYLPLAGPVQGSAFTRVMRDQGVALPILNLAVWLARDLEIVVDIRIALGPAGPIPQRALAAESVLRGRPFTPENLAAAQQALLAEVHFRTSPQRATAEYRQHLVGRLLADALHKAWERAA